MLDWRSLNWMLWVALLAQLSLITPAAEAAEPKSEQRVRLIVDFGDGVELRFTRLAWREDMTVLDAMLDAERHPRGVEIQYRGKGATAFVYQIDDLKNEATGRGWTYRVNDKLADRSCGIHPLQAGDTVLWRFQKYR